MGHPLFAWAVTATLVLGLGSATAQEAGTHHRYAVLVKDTTSKNPAWQKVVNALVERYNAEVFPFTAEIEEAQGKLCKYQPTELALVAPPEDVGFAELPTTSQEHVWQSMNDIRAAAILTVQVRLNRLANNLDSDPFRDAKVGLVTGYTAEDALRVATTPDFQIETALLKADEDKLAAFPQGIGYSEDTDRGTVVKTTKRGEVTETQSITAVGEDILEAINHGGAQLLCTTGHGNYNQWKISYSEDRVRIDKWLFSQNGTVYLVNAETSKAVDSIASTVPKVIVNNGNCRMGGIQNKNAIHLAWQHSGGAVQCIGYMVDTWFGATGWGINEQMFNNPGISWAEAHMRAELALQDRRERLLEVRGGGEDLAIRSEGGKQLFGHLYDSDVLAFTGDPGTSVTIRVDPHWKPIYTIDTSTRTKGKKTIHRFSVHINREGIGKPIVIPTAQDLTRSTVTTSPSDLHVRVIDNAIIMDPVWQSVTKEDGQLVIRNRTIQPNDEYSVELTGNR